MKRLLPWRQALSLLAASLLWACSAPGSQPEAPPAPVREESGPTAPAPSPVAPVSLPAPTQADRARAQELAAPVELRPAPPPPAAPAKLMAQGSHALMAPLVTR